MIARALWVLVVTGCWTEEPLIDGLFTRAEWDQLQLMHLEELTPDLCRDMPRDKCDAAAQLGQQLFFQPALSGPIITTTADDPGAFGDRTCDVGKIACINCHKPENFFVDPRATNISLGASYTSHNALGLVNTGFKAVQAEKNCQEAPTPVCSLAFAWNGRYSTPGDVLKIAGLGKAAMHSTRHIIAEVIRNNGAYLMNYTAAFGAPPPDDNSCLAPDEAEDTSIEDCHIPASSCADAEVFDHVAIAFDRYERRLVGGISRFDSYIRGTVGDDHQTSSRDRLSDGARRGLAVFLHKGLCIDCHNGPLFSDLQFHDTGVPQRGPHLPTAEDELGAVGLGPQYTGMFLTQPLRNVSRTAPYMHGGQFATIGEVIDFYRHGGGVDGFSGIKDPRLEELEIDDQDAHDLEEFLKSLEGLPVPEALTTKPGT